MAENRSIFRILAIKEYYYPVIAIRLWRRSNPYAFRLLRRSTPRNDTLRENLNIIYNKSLLTRSFMKGWLTKFFGLTLSKQGFMKS
jgi:hypothetical protein